MLEAAGLTTMDASQQLFQLNSADTRGKTALEVFQLVTRLIKRIYKGAVTVHDYLLAIAVPVLRKMLPKEGVAFLDQKCPKSIEALLDSLQQWWAITRGRTSEDIQPKPKPPAFPPGRFGALKCFSCGRLGHRASECRSRPFTGSYPSPLSTTAPTTGDEGYPWTCYTCGKRGHKSPSCPQRVVGNRPPPNMTPETAPVKQLTMRPKTSISENVVRGKVGSMELDFVLDTGASVSVVPSSCVRDEQLLDECVIIEDANGGEARRSLAMVDIVVKGLVSQTEVAVAPDEVLKGKVLFAISLENPDHRKFLREWDDEQPAHPVRAVSTRARVVEAAATEAEEAALIAVEQPRCRPAAGVPAEPTNLVVDSERKVPVVVPSVEVLTYDSEPAPVSLQPEATWDVDSNPIVEEEDSVCLPPLESGSAREKLCSESKLDKSLAVWRGLANEGLKGFKWKDDLMFLTVMDPTFQAVEALVLPKEFRVLVMRTAHDGAGHLGHRKVLQMIKKRFVWPLMAKDVTLFCQSCQVCQSCSRASVRKAPMVERPVLTEPFEQMAFDLVSPLPKAKGGYRFVLTAVCMATRWPEAIPLKSITARAVAEGIVNIFSRTAIPLQILSDQGTQFLSSLVKELCKLLGIQRLKTTAYHPQTNGTVERMHSTLEGMLTKDHTQGMDWAFQIPFALFALRQMPHRDTLLSPFDLIFG